MAEGDRTLMPGGHLREKSSGHRGRATAARDYDGCPLEAMSDVFLLAAIDRAERHERRSSVPLVVIFDHLNLVRSIATTRKLRRILGRLVESGGATRSVRHGSDVWGVTPNGRRRVARAMRSPVPLELPESPQHQKWRSERTKATEGIDELRGQVRSSLERGLTLLAIGPGKAEDWHTLAELLHRQCRQLGSAIYCLNEWAEPDDARSDLDARLLARLFTKV